MNSLRLMLLGLAAVVLVALGWRLVAGPGRVTPGDTAATRPAAERQAVQTPGPEPAARAEAPAVEAPPAPPTPQSPSPPAARIDRPEAPAVPVPGPAVPPAPEKPAPGMTAQDARARLDAVLPAAPDLARAFDVLRSQFPSVAERSLAEATEAYRQSNALPSPDDLFADAMHNLRQSSGVLAAKAGPEALGALFEMKATLLADLEQADPRICADYLFGGTSPEFSDFEASHRSLIAQAALVDIRAIADGRARQTAWAPPSPEDFQWIEGELRKDGLSPDEISALLDGRPADPPPTDARLCDNGRTYLSVLKTMPAEARNRIYGLTAELLARS